jgi:hypothetical protein
MQAGFAEPDRNRTYSKAGPCSISTEQITENIRELYQTARDMPSRKFLVGCTQGHATLCGYSDAELAACFARAGSDGRSTGIPRNVIFEAGFFKLVLNADALSCDRQ